MATRLQLVLEDELETSLNILRRVRPYIDNVEVGTQLLMREGMHALHAIRQEFPELRLCADVKIMDDGEAITTIALDAGADIVTVLGVAHNATVRAVVRVAHERGKRVMADMLRVSGITTQGMDLVDAGVDFLRVHTKYDLQQHSSNPVTKLRRLREAMPDVPMVASGGIGLMTFDIVMALSPAIIIVGSAITKADDPVAVAQTLRHKINQNAS